MKRWNENDDPVIWKNRMDFLRDRALRRMRPPMRAKYAKEIRLGVLAAKAAVARVNGNMSVPIYFPVNFSPLAFRAYDRTLTRLVANEVLASGRRMLNKVYERWPETRPDGQDR